MPWGRTLCRRGLAAAAVLLAAGCAGHDDGGATATIEAPARKVAATAILQKLDLNVPVDLDVPELAHAAPALAAAPAFNGLAETQSPDDAARALDCLTQAVYYEAGNQSDDGERAVAQVVLNRVRDRAFPASVCGVVYQGSTRSTGCQFSFTCDGSMNRRPSASGWARARAVAGAALGGEVYAPVGSATFYHANYVSPWWAASMDQVTQIGAHIFYRWRGGMENALAFRQRYSGSEPNAVARASSIARVDSVDGVTVSYGIRETAGLTTGGVTIHRGGASAGAVAAPSATLAAAQAMTRMPRKLSGVRVRLGVTSANPGEDLSDRATID